MAYFPIFIDLKEKNILVIGAGKVAYRKIEKLLPFEANIYVITKEIKDKRIENLKNQIHLEIREFKLEDLKGKDIVINATNDLELQKKVYEECLKLKIPVNSVDNPKYCSFIFPSYIKEGDLIIGISTSGKAPILSKEIKNLIKDCLPKNMDRFLEKLSTLRKNLKNEKNKNEILENIIKRFFDRNK
jgi:precorrin-2 dehydrogenase/sirohydrochlorin ferrochelatase